MKITTHHIIDIEAIRQLVSDEYFANEMKKRIGHQIDTAKIDTEIGNYKNKMKEVELNKTRLEHEYMLK